MSKAREGEKQKTTQAKFFYILSISYCFLQSFAASELPVLCSCKVSCGQRAFTPFRPLWGVLSSSRGSSVCCRSDRALSSSCSVEDF